MSRAVFALLLALLLPARAAALCCLDGPALPEASSHERAHHAPAAPAGWGDVLTGADGAPACESPEASAPALRERGPADDAGITLAVPPPPPPPLPVTASRAPTTLARTVSAPPALHDEIPRPLRL